MLQRSCETVAGGGRMHFEINGRAFDAEVDVRTSILDLVRDHLGLTGTKKGCKLTVLFIHCRKRLLHTMAFSAATARQARFARPLPW